jgi:selenocysteine lyase/cysteine desulfurase
MEYSTMPYAAAIALGRAIAYISGLSLAEVAGHNRELASQLADGLTQRGVIVSPRVGSTRFSTHFYNSSDDVDHALGTLDEVLR